MWLKSDAFETGAAIPRRYTCDGENLSPPLVWGDVPERAESLVMLCDDPDAPNGVWRHWAAFNISVRQTGLEEGAAGRPDLAQAVNDFGETGYGGPCPPHGHGRHRYRFHLLALSQGLPPLGARPDFLAVEQVARARLLAEALLVGTYAR